MRGMLDECVEGAKFSRRSLLRGSAASLALWGMMPRTASASTRNPRFLTVILRGGLDGIAMIAPVGDPNYARLRGNLAIPASGDNAGLPLHDIFALNANMPFLHGLYGRREALAIHAIATPYRSRSHFDGQDVLESGLPTVARVEDGWLNRALAGLPSTGQTAPRKGLAMGAVVPLVMRGEAPVLSWSPKIYNLPLRESTIARLKDLYNVTDPKLAKAFADGLEIDRISSGPAAIVAAPNLQPGSPRPFREFIETAEVAAKFLSAADGPRIGALSYNGWDTHANEGVIQGQLGNRLAGLDAAIKALHDGLGSAWKETVVAVVTEFGRTVKTNGTEGTDHGTGMAVLLIGGAVKGGRVLADWPGLGEAALHEGRDLKPTLDLRAVLKGVLRDHLGVPDGVLAKTVFPDSQAERTIDGLVS